MSQKGLGSGPVSPELSQSQLTILRAIAVASASISVLSGLIVGWWFVRMKRSFRHHLIMLMIFSDFFKASWQLIYPAVVFTRGRVDSHTRFCQTSGFLMTMGIEASDFAVLAIAVHSALYIFRPGMGAIGEGGLFRYRYYMYACWLAFAVVMPSLAFINPNPAYTSQSTFCYLPVRPFWYRMALAWIPRYIILLTIMILYAAIYIYVRMKFRTFRTSVGASTLDLDTMDLATVDQPKDPSRLPPLDAHGLIPPSPAVDSRQPSQSCEQPFPGGFLSAQSFPRALLAPLADKLHSSAFSDYGSRRGSDPTLCVGNLPNGHAQAEREMAERRRQASEATASEETRRRRAAISRQLRLLFVYPLMYTLMWVPPLVSNSLEFTDRFVYHPSFPLHCVVAFTLPFQCAVDCWLFTIREKPWRYIPDTRKTNWYARYGFWSRRCHGRSAEKGAEEGGDEDWRNRKHMTFEARKAYERRDAERKEAAETWLKTRRASLPTNQRPQPRSWWDVLSERHEHATNVEESSLEEEGEGPQGEVLEGEHITVRDMDELSRLENGRGDGGPNVSSRDSSNTSSATSSTTGEAIPHTTL